MKTYVIEGEYTITDVKSQRWIIPGTFPRRFWDVITAENEDDLAAYLSGQQAFIPEPEHACARCQRSCKPQFKHCYRCYQYLLKK